MVRLHGQHNSFYAAIEGLTKDGRTKDERAASRAERRGTLHRNGMGRQRPAASISSSVL